MRKLLILAVLLMLSISASAQVETPPVEVVPVQPLPGNVLPRDLSIFEFLNRHVEYTTFVSWLEETGLAARLQEPGPYTVFALSNDAINSTPQAIIDRIVSDPEFKTAVMETHITLGEYDLNDLENAAEGAISSLQGEPYSIHVTATGLRINDVRFVSTRLDDLYANGIINAVQRVILPVSLLNDF